MERRRVSAGKDLIGSYTSASQLVNRTSNPNPGIGQMPGFSFVLLPDPMQLDLFSYAERRHQRYLREAG